METDYSSWAVFVQCEEEGAGNKFLSTRLTKMMPTMTMTIMPMPTMTLMMMPMTMISVRRRALETSSSQQG